jgi:uncharacterized membrane protein
MSRPSKRFNPGRWMERLVPVLLALLALGLLATLVIIALAVLGVIPGG